MSNGMENGKKSLITLACMHDKQWHSKIKSMPPEL